MTRDPHRALFREETFELLSDLESFLLELEETPGDEELICRGFRTMHTIKGNAGMFGLDRIKTLAHEVETLFDLVNQGKIPVTQKLIDLTLAVCDLIRYLVEDPKKNGDVGTDQTEAILAGLKRLIPDDVQKQDAPDTPSPLNEWVEPAILRLLTEKEELLLRRKIKENKNIFFKNVAFAQADFDKELYGLTNMFKKNVDFIAVLPQTEKTEPDTIGFCFLFASDKNLDSLTEILGLMPEPMAVGRKGDRIASNTDITEDGPDHSLPSVTYRIRFRPSLDILKKGVNPMSVLNEIRKLGKTTAVAQPDTIPSLEEMDPALCYTYWDVILTTKEDLNAVKDLFVFYEDDSDVDVQIIDKDGRLGNEKNCQKLGEILIEHGDLTLEDLNKILAAQKPIGEMLVEAGVVQSDKIQYALSKQEHVRKLHEVQPRSEPSTSVRVPSEKMDVLVNLVGELVTVQARLSQMALSQSDPNFLLISEELERLTAALRENATSIRMLPIGTTLFAKYKRLVRDLSVELGKKIELTMDGVETELDKTLIEQLHDPLVHLIRNCIDHGIEEPQVRESLGKSEVGRIHLSAVHSGANVLIEISDDGAGLDPETIRCKAEEKGLITPGVEVGPKELFDCLFVAGFSTAGKVTEISGRGVGMDVVKQNIDALRGSIDVRSEKGRGTKITLKVPLTLAIIEGFLVQVERDYFVFPLSLVEECVELSQEEAASAHGRHLANVRGEIVPYVRLREQFDIEGVRPDMEQVVIASLNGDRVGFVVDFAIGNYQTVIKSLGRVYRDVEGISGATILGDGTIALILDVPKLIHILNTGGMTLQPIR